MKLNILTKTSAKRLGLLGSVTLLGVTIWSYAGANEEAWCTEYVSGSSGGPLYYLDSGSGDCASQVVSGTTWECCPHLHRTYTDGSGNFASFSAKNYALHKKCYNPAVPGFVTSGSYTLPPFNTVINCEQFPVE